MKRAICYSLILLLIIMLCSFPAQASPADEYDVTITQYTVGYVGSANNFGRVFLPYDGTMNRGDCLWWTIAVTAPPGTPIRMSVAVYGAIPRRLPDCKEIKDFQYVYTPPSEYSSMPWYLGMDGLWYQNPFSAIWHADATRDAAMVTVFITPEITADAHWPVHEVTIVNRWSTQEAIEH